MFSIVVVTRHFKEPFRLPVRTEALHVVRVIFLEVIDALNEIHDVERSRYRLRRRDHLPRCMGILRSFLADDALDYDLIDGIFSEALHVDRSEDLLSLLGRGDHVGDIELLSVRS